MLQRRGTSTEWSLVENDVILQPGELAVETGTGKFKIGDGASLWSELSYVLDDAGNELKYLQLTGNQTLTGDSASTVSFTVNAATSQSAKIQSWKVAGTEKASISSAGKITANGFDANSNKITGVAEPTADTDAATKSYVDDAIAGLAWKEAVNLLATSDVALTGNTNTLVIDGHAALTQSHGNGYRILLTNQTPATENGIYVYSDNGTTYTMTRSTDAQDVADLVGASVYVQDGTAYMTSSWVQTNYHPDTFDDLVWVQFSGAALISDGAGLYKDGNTLSVIGTADRITVTPDNVDIASNYVGQTSITTLGTITTGIWDGQKIAITKGGTGATTATDARSNLGLGNSAVLDTGTTGTTVALGDHTHDSRYYTQSQVDSALALKSSLDSSPTFTGIVKANNYDISVITLSSDTVALDFSSGTGLGYRSAVAGDLTFTGSNYRAGAIKTVVLTNGASARNLTFPSSWIFVGTKPTSLAASKTAVLTVTSLGTTEAACVAGWAVQI
jgi:hypothetical protein